MVPTVDTGNLALLLDENASAFADRPALVLGDRMLTYAELDAAASQVANLLVGRGVARGDRVAVTCPNIPEFTILYFGILKAGAVVVPLNVMLKAEDVAYHLDDAGACLYVCYEGLSDSDLGREGHQGYLDSGCERFILITNGALPADSALAHCDTLAEAMHGLPEEFATVIVRDHDLAVILYTSGTTGRPKGAELCHRNLLSNARATEFLFGLDTRSPDVYLGALPLAHSFGQTVVQNSALCFGSTVVLMPRFDAHQALALMKQHTISFFAGVPTMYWSLLAAAADDVELESLRGNLRIAVSGGAALPYETHRRFQVQFDVTILEGYGLSETAPIASFSRFGVEPRVGSVGTPIPGVDMRLLKVGTWEPFDWTPGAVGEVAIRGPNVMRGYHGREDETRSVLRDGWLRTGDLARRDEQGWYYIVDRVTDVIIRGGYNIYPREVEQVLALHPDVDLVAVVGVQDDRVGEEIKAFVVPAAGAELNPEDIVTWSRRRMPAYKYPRLVQMERELPLTATGKILKRALVTSTTEVWPPTVPGVA